MVKRKIWIEQSPRNPTACLIHTEEPAWHDGEEWLGSYGGILEACLRNTRKIVGRNIPPQPELLEVEFVVTSTTIWEPVPGATSE